MFYFYFLNVQPLSYKNIKISTKPITRTIIIIVPENITTYINIDMELDKFMYNSIIPTHTYEGISLSSDTDFDSVYNNNVVA